VYVSGAVVNPGVYELPPGARVHDALALAGGALDAADLTRVDLAAPVSDGEQVNVPRTGDPTATATVKPKSTRIVATPTPTGVWLVNVNTATVNDFTQLPGIGKVTAQKLVDYRDQNGPYSNVDDLLKAGLRASELVKIRDRLTVQ
jgi:competence protein ComEA